MQTLRTRWNHSYTVLLLCWFGWISIYLCRSALPPVLPILIEELEITHSQAGLFATAFLIGYIIIKIPVGTLAKRIGTKNILILSMVGYGFATMLNILATTFLQLLILRFFVGLFQGVHLPVANTLLSERFKRRQGRAIGFHESGPNVGNAIALPLSVTIASLWSWRWAFFLLSLPAFVLAFSTVFILKDDKNVEEPNIPPENNPIEEIGLRFYIQLLVSLALAHAVYNLCLQTLFNFAPTFLVESRGMSLATAGFISMIMPATGFFAKISSGFIAEKFGRINAICAATTLSGIFIAALTFFKGEYELAIIFMLIGLVLYSYSPTIYAYVTAMLPIQTKTTGLSLVTMTGNIAGAFSAPFVGYLIDTQGYNIALIAVSSSVLFMTSIIYIILKNARVFPNR